MILACNSTGDLLAMVIIAVFALLFFLIAVNS